MAYIKPKLVHIKNLYYKVVYDCILNNIYFFNNTTGMNHLKNMLFALLIFAKFTLSGHVFVKNSWSEFHDNSINSLVGNTKQKRRKTVSQSPFCALQFNYDNSNQRTVIRTNSVST